MSNAWSIYVITLTTIMIVGCVWLLWYTSRPSGGNPDDTTGHVWDGDIREYNKPLPRWSTPKPRQILISKKVRMNWAVRNLSWAAQFVC